ncbi:unnamed protein product [Rhodiola kirilowii]
MEKISADSTNLEHEIDCSNFFDHIEDLLLDFPQQDNVFVGSRGDSFPAAWNGSCFDPDSVTRCSPDLAAELSLPYEDVVQMEWLSNFMEESFSGGNSIMTLDKQQFPSTKDVALAPVQFQSLSPISVLESSSSSSSSSNSCTDVVGKVLPLGADNSVSIRGGCGRARSKRPRPPTFNPESAMQLISPAQSFTEGENFNESNHLTKAKKRKAKASCSVEMMSHMADHVTSESQAGVRKCLHCEITKTPQWRAGPMGPKTLCNACGVRHKSGRLFPEYRPAASPTFVPSLHSNSHKKVLEMRTTTVDIPANTTAYDAQPEFIPNKNAMLELEYI